MASSPDATGHSEDDGDLTRTQAGSDLLTLTRDELARMVEAAQRCVAGDLLQDWHAERTRHLRLLREAMTRLCELGETSRSSPIVRGIIQTLGH
jgi:hypothetical protein